MNGILEMEKGAPSGTLRPNLAAALNPRDAAAFEGVPRAGKAELPNLSTRRALPWSGNEWSGI